MLKYGLAFIGLALLLALAIHPSVLAQGAAQGRSCFRSRDIRSVATPDMKTVNLNVAPKYIHEKDKEPQLVGYTASYDLNVTVRKLDDMGKVLDALAENGANRHMTISFGCSDLDKLLDEARAKAAAAARHNAEVLAANAGGSLGVVLEISEGVNYPQYRLEFDRAAPTAAKDLPVAPGEQVASALVTVTYTLSPLPAHS